MWHLEPLLPKTAHKQFNAPRRPNRRGQRYYRMTSNLAQSKIKQSQRVNIFIRILLAR